MDEQIVPLHRRTDSVADTSAGCDGRCDSDECSQLPTWVRCLGVPAWVRNPSGKISYLNARAEKLFGVRAEDCVGQPCFRIIDAWDAFGKPVCERHCKDWCLALLGGELEPANLKICDVSGNMKHVKVITLSVILSGDALPSLVHCALDGEKEHELSTYFLRVAARTPHTTSAARRLRDAKLTAREIEVLHHLTRDMTLHWIAMELGISYATVRNHVQHILDKTGVHSTMEAVACYLLSKE